MSRLSKVIHEALIRTLDTVWLRQPQAIRVAVPPSQRPDARRERACARAMLREAVTMDPGCARDDLAAAALRKLLAVVGRASASDAADAGAAGAARVRASLRSEPLEAALASALATAPAPAGEERFRALVDLCAWTDALVDDRSDRHKRVERGAGVAAVAVAALAAAQALFGARNLAYGKSVTASSVCNKTPPSPYHEPPLSRVVDGVRYEAPPPPPGWGWATFAACTIPEVHAWIAVDLGEERALSRAVVYGRSDCCWHDVLPLAVQISTDNRHFMTVATTDTPFTSEFPWKPSLDGRRARYVRLYTESGAPKSIVVSELEVYGR
ncbi:MAG TPA: discoidin domain-containing protein [Polyangiaceae bacterium]|nr:discoidin domain-containing protein [Polyangiaceae bacterium]